MLLTSANIGDVVNFSVYPSSIIGTSFQRVKVKAFLDADSARAYLDPTAMHLAVFPTLPPGVPNDPDKYPWVKLELENGKITVVGLPWIDEITVEVQSSTQLQIVVSEITAADVARVRQALVAAGFNKLAFTML